MKRNGIIKRLVGIVMTGAMMLGAFTATQVTAFAATALTTAQVNTLYASDPYNSLGQNNYQDLYDTFCLYYRYGTPDFNAFNQFVKTLCALTSTGSGADAQCKALNGTTIGTMSGYVRAVYAEISSSDLYGKALTNDVDAIWDWICQRTLSGEPNCINRLDEINTNSPKYYLGSPMLNPMLDARKNGINPDESRHALVESYSRAMYYANNGAGAMKSLLGLSNLGNYEFISVNVFPSYPNKVQLSDIYFYNM